MNPLDIIELAAHHVREHLAKRPGMKVGKVLRRMYPHASDKEVQDLAHAWDNGWDVELLGRNDDWAAVTEVASSCMSRYGNAYRDAYSSVGVQMLVFTQREGDRSRILIQHRRGLHGRADRILCAPYAYGLAHFALEAIVGVVLGAKTQGWHAAVRGARAELREVKEFTVRREPRQQLAAQWRWASDKGPFQAPGDIIEIPGVTTHWRLVERKEFRPYIDIETRP